MREILFRGKTPENKWIYGGIKMDCERVWIDQEYLGETIVDKKTVGQYTGLKDKNGVKIFEGDIVEYEIMKDFIDIGVAYRNIVICLGKVEFDGGFVINGLERQEYIRLYINENHPVKVIGNIYDNPKIKFDYGEGIEEIEVF